MPDAGACQVIHKEWPPGLFACLGSPGSSVAKRLSPNKVPDSARVTSALEKSSSKDNSSAAERTGASKSLRSRSSGEASNESAVGNDLASIGEVVLLNTES